MRLDGHLLVLGLASLIRILIWSDRLYYPGPVIGRRCIMQLLSLYLYLRVVQAGVRLELPLCSGHVVVGQVRQPCYARVVWAPAPHHRIGVAAYASGNSFLVTQGHILRRKDISPSVIEPILISLKLLLLLFQASSSGY